MEIRNYIISDCEKILRLFYDTVHTVNAKDYNRQQIDVWAPKNANLALWENKLASQNTIVAVEGGALLGFGSITQDGELDLLYVQKDNIAKGIGTELCNELEKRCTASEIIVYASITAKPFFEKCGYKVLRDNKVERGGVTLHNYLMLKATR